MSMFEEEPIFDEHYLPKNINYVSYMCNDKMITEVFMMDDKDFPCKKTYENGRCVKYTSWNNIEEMKGKMDMEHELFNAFYKWVKDHEKEKATIISIKKY